MWYDCAMPTYEYKCSVCTGQQELNKAHDDETIPVCCDVSMTRLWSAIPTIFKTGGFYKTGG